MKLCYWALFAIYSFANWLSNYAAHASIVLLLLKSMAQMPQWSLETGQHRLRMPHGTALRALWTYGEQHDIRPQVDSIHKWTQSNCQYATISCKIDNAPQASTGSANGSETQVCLIHDENIQSALKTTQQDCSITKGSGPVRLFFWLVLAYSLSQPADINRLINQRNNLSVGRKKKATITIVPKLRIQLWASFSLPSIKAGK